MDDSTPPTYQLTQNGDSTVIAFAGDWRLSSPRPELDRLLSELEDAAPGAVDVEAKALGAWDTGLMVTLYHLATWCEARGLALQTPQLPAEAQGLLALALAVPEKEGAHQETPPDGLFTSFGKLVMGFWEEFCGLICFAGEAMIACGNALTKGPRFRPVDFWLIVQQTGVDALPIVALLSFLVGLIFAFVGAVQLEALGASIYIADLVGLSMTREMGAIMSAIILSGRTGAAFAANLGSMKANEELDALETLGISPVAFLVVPRIFAMVLMLPLLVLFSIFIGMVGGLLIGVFVLDLTSAQYIQQTVSVVDLNQFIIGLAKAVVFAVLVAASGCMRGLQAGGSSEGVGRAATSAVVTGITAVIVADAIFAIFLNVLGI